MNRGTAGIILIMLAILGIYLYIRSDFIKKLLGGTVPGSSADVGGGGGGGGSSGAMSMAGGSPNEQIGPDLGGGTVYPGNTGEPFSGSANMGHVGTSYGLGFPSSTQFANYASYPDPQREYDDNTLSEPVRTHKYGSVNIGFAGL